MESTNYLTFENAKLIFKNFKGEKTQFNREGNRNFCVVIENHEDAEALKNDGWNVKQLSSKDDEEDVLYYLPVAVAFDPYPPRVELIGGRRVLLDEENISTLDQVDIKTVDLVLRPYTWEVNGKTGVKAYLKTMYVTINEDPYAAKYEHIPFGD